jgi:zinc/manganese transport system permease protein
MTLYEFLIDPFLGSDAMKLALAATLAVSIAGAPLGVMLIIRRMALAGDVLTHTLLPGVAAAYLIAGQSPAVMIMGGTISGLIAVYLSMLVSRSTILREDTSLATFLCVVISIGYSITICRDKSF